MNEKELRIGNYVNLIAEGHEKEPDTFKWDLEDYEFYYDRMDFIKPIPLTEEWLLKFGFERIFENSNLFLNITNDIYFFLYNDKLKGCVRNHHTSYDNQLSELEFELNIEFIHQLQNLYFCLTNKELELCGI